MGLKPEFFIYQFRPLAMRASERLWLPLSAHSPSSDRDLSRGTLASSSLDDLTKEDLINVLGVKVDLGKRMLDDRRSQLGRGQRGKGPVEGSNRRPGRSYDIDRRLLSDGTGLTKNWHDQRQVL